MAFTPAAPGRVRPLGALRSRALPRGHAASHRPAALWGMAYYSPSSPFPCDPLSLKQWGAFAPLREGGPDGIRTRDLLNAIEARSQLRYGPTVFGSVEPTGFEPATSPVREERSPS